MFLQEKDKTADHTRVPTSMFALEIKTAIDALNNLCDCDQGLSILYTFIDLMSELLAAEYAKNIAFFAGGQEKKSWHQELEALYDVLYNQVEQLASYHLNSGYNLHDQILKYATARDAVLDLWSKLDSYRSNPPEEQPKVSTVTLRPVDEKTMEEYNKRACAANVIVKRQKEYEANISRYFSSDIDNSLEKQDTPKEKEKATDIDSSCRYHRG